VAARRLIISGGWHTFDVTADADPLICSAKGCRAPASWALRWNNPRIHPATRRKTWLACDDHKERLMEFLKVRAFLREVDPLP